MLRDRATGVTKYAIDRAVSPLGLELVNKGSRHDWSNIANYIPFEPTIEAAKQAGLSVGDYIDEVMNGIPGATQHTVDQIAAMGVFDGPIELVVEIGPGSGRYIDKTLKRCTPKRYEIYETAQKWANYAAQTYSAVLQPTDGKSLAATATASADLVQAHKVFSATAFLVTVRYWIEIARVIRAGGYAVFDIVTEACLDPTALRRWIASGRGNSTYPAVIPRAVAVDYFASEGFTLAGSFIVPMGPGTTETYVFRKNRGPATAAG